MKTSMRQKAIDFALFALTLLTAACHQDNDDYMTQATLRLDGGDTLTMALKEDERVLHARLTNNGLQPEGPIREQGGLKSLRTLTEQAGGRMTVSVAPEFAVCLDLPKEEKDHAVSRSDRG